MEVIPGNLDPPDNPILVEGALQIIRGPGELSKNARIRAQDAFDLDQMVREYCQVLLD